MRNVIAITAAAVFLATARSAGGSNQVNEDEKQIKIPRRS